MSDTTVDVQKIMEEIKAEIAAKGLVNDIPSMEEVVTIGSAVNGTAPFLDSLKRELDYLKRHEIHYYREITSYHKAVAPIVKFVKRVIRKLCKFLGEPTVNEINDYHKHVVKALEQAVKVFEKTSLSDVQKSDEAKMLEERKYKQLAERYASMYYSLTKKVENLEIRYSSCSNEAYSDKMLNEQNALDSKH